MKLLRYAIDDVTYAGVLNGDEIMRLGVRNIAELMPADAAFVETGILDNLADARVLPPLQPGKILAIGRNYAEHARELGNEAPSEPLVFAVMPSAVIGDGDVIEWEAEMTAQVDWEGELAVIIGETARKVSEARRWNTSSATQSPTMSRPATCKPATNSGRGRRGSTRSARSVPSSSPPMRSPTRRICRIVTTVDGVEKQNGSTADMIFSVRFLIAHLSRAFTLNPGDVILTGTPAGVGKAQNPPQFLEDGSIVSIAIDGIGKLTNRCRVLY